MYAAIQRDYSMDDPMLIFVCPGKITVTSPGGVREHCTSDRLADIPSPGNRNLAAILYRLRIIEAYSNGVPHIFSSYCGLFVKPMIKTGECSFTIMLPAVNEDRKGKLTAFLESRVRFTRSEMEKELGMNKSEVVSILGGLLGNGIVTRIGQGRFVRYEVIVLK